MEANIVSKFKDKGALFYDIVLFCASAILVAAIFCWAVFYVKIYLQKEELGKITQSIKAVGTPEEKEYEKQIFDYRNKIIAFSKFIKNHRVTSNVFAYMEENTLPNVWYKKFNLAVGGARISLTAEAEDMEALARQVTIFEESQFFDKVTVLSSTAGESGRVSFTLSLVLNEKIFDFTPITVKEPS